MRPLQPLTDDQAAGAAPPDSAWVSASAGTGKTQVLTARVLRLLLQGAPPERILCLTFTKAAAAEMQARIFERLAGWVAAGDNALKADLAALRAGTDPETVARARSLFARTLEARGGLSVQTLHGYAQSLLASFPLEAGIAPGFEALDDRSGAALRGRVLAEAIDLSNDAGFADDLAAISIASGEPRLAGITATLMRHHEAIAALGPPDALTIRLRRKVGLPIGGSADDLLDAALAELDHDALRRLAQIWKTSGLVSYGDRLDALLWWLDCAGAVQVRHFDRLHRVFHTQEGKRYAVLVPGGKKADPDDVAMADRLGATVGKVGELHALLTVVERAARHLRVGARLGGGYALHKARAGVIDYDDMIDKAAALLTRTDIGAWVRYKLDQRLDHLLVDEAQDTNEAQWEIIEALTDEFFDGEGARDTQRTLFVVGDFKQAIFSFQGSDPKVFDARSGHFRAKATDAARGWRDVPLSASYRSVPAVLEVVDAVVGTLGAGAFGRDEAGPPHGAARGDLPGAVTLWPPLVPDVADAPEDASEEAAWLPQGQVQFAHKLARQIADWLDPAAPLWLAARARAVRAEDILVLVRARGEFVGALVGALHDLGVPVAGVDRLRLTAPLAVQDCLALIRFVLQPNDDLTCAALLTSPFLGWDQDALFALAHARRGTLWEELRRVGGAAADWLRAVLALADFSAPYEFLETVLSGPLAGRKRLLARLGGEAREAIAALLAQALAFERAHAPSLQGFLAWIETDDIDLKRDPEAPVDAVRILTVHAAKGLQAPVVVLADATAAMPRDTGGHVLMALGDDERSVVPVFHGGKAGKVGAIATRAAEADADRAAEHWRLLYVALTRAEDLLFVGGALARPRGDTPAKLPDDSWYAMVERAVVETWDPTPDADGLWGAVRRHSAGSAPAVPDPRAAAAARTGTLPDWALRPAAPEARPPRPLSPSAIAADDIAQPPPGPAAVAAARRGQLLHTLFERLPGVAGDRRRRIGSAWLGRAAPDLAADARTALLGTALGIIEAPRFAALFGPDALAEAPIAATVGDLVIAGKVDRLLIEPARVQLVDFKTGSRVPASPDLAAPYHLRQMAAYVAALRQIFPAHRIDAALLYTHDATLLELPPALLAAHAPVA